MSCDIYSSEMCIIKAASLVRGSRSLDRIMDICDNQKSINTKKLKSLLDDVEEDFILNGIFMKGVADRMRKLENGESNE